MSILHHLVLLKQTHPTLVGIIIKKTKFVKNRAMVLVLKKGASKKEIENIKKKLYDKKTAPGFNAKKYNGVIRLKDDALKIQKTLRNGWERDFS